MLTAHGELRWREVEGGRDINEFKSYCLGNLPSPEERKTKNLNSNDRQATIAPRTGSFSSCPMSSMSSFSVKCLKLSHNAGHMADELKCCFSSIGLVTVHFFFSDY